MYYKTKKLYELSSIFQTNLFRHYRKLLAPINPVQSKIYNWLTLLSLIVLGGALFQSTFVLFGYAFLWNITSIGRDFLFYYPSFFYYTPVSLSFWIFAISIFTTIYGIFVCYSFPKEFRMLLLIEQGLSLKLFLLKSWQIKYKLFFFLFFFVLLFFFFPRILIIIIWAFPIWCEFYCLSGITNAYLIQNLKSYSNQTFATLLGLEYYVLMQKQLENNFFLFHNENFDDFLFDDTEDVGQGDNEDEFDEYLDFDDYEQFDQDFEYEDVEDSAYTIDDTLYNRRLSMEQLQVLNRRLNKNNVSSGTLFVPRVSESVKYRKNFSEFDQLQDMSLNFKYHYKKVPNLFRYLKAKKEIELGNKKKNYTITDLNRLYKVTTVNNFKSIESRLWTKTKLNRDVLHVPSHLSWHNTNLPFLFESIFQEYEELSESLSEADVDFWNLHYSDDEEQEIYEAELLEMEIFGNHQENLTEPGAGDEFLAPNWSWIFFFYHSLVFWVIVNCFILTFFFICGIPETWLLSTRTAAGRNILIYETMLHMTETLYTKWGFTKLPNGKLRLEYFSYMQPSYFRRSPKLAKLVRSFVFENKMHGLGYRYWARKYKYKRLYGITQGVSPFNKKYYNFERYWRHSKSVLVENRSILNQNIGHLYLNSNFFIQKDKQVNDFYKIFNQIQNVK